jgi:hypothetical protein
MPPVDMDWTRLALGAGIGAGIGAMILLGWGCTGWILPRSLPRLGGFIPAAVVLLSTVAYMFFSYANRPPLTLPPTPPVVAASEPMPHTQIDVGGVTLSFDPPGGYCLYPADLMQVVRSMHERANKDNVVHAAFGDCEQLRGHEQTGARIRDFGLLMTPTAMLGKSLSRQALDQLARASFDPQQLKETASQRIRDAVGRLDMHSFAAVGILDRDGNSIYFGFLSKLQAGDETFSQAYVMALTLIRSRLVAIYLYSDYTKNPRTALQRLVTTSKAEVGAFAGLNP